MIYTTHTLLTTINTCLINVMTDIQRWRMFYNKHVQTLEKMHWLRRKSTYYMFELHNVPTFTQLWSHTTNKIKPPCKLGQLNNINMLLMHTWVATNTNKIKCCSDWVQFSSVTFWHILFCSVLFCSIVFCSILFCSNTRNGHNFLECCPK